MRQTADAAELPDSAIESAILRAEPGQGIEAQTKLLIGEEKQLIESLTPEWQFREVLRLIQLVEPPWELNAGEPAVYELLSWDL